MFNLTLEYISEENEYICNFSFGSNKKYIRSLCVTLYGVCYDNELIISDTTEKFELFFRI